MTDKINDSQLQLIAIQLDFIRENFPKTPFIGRVKSRLRREFLQKNGREKVRFVKYAVRETIQRVNKWARSVPRREIRGNVAHDGLWVAVVCNGGMGDIIIYSALLDRFFRECGFPTIHAVIHPLRLEEAEFVFHNSPSVKAVITQADLQPESTPYDVILKLGDFLSYEFIRDDRVRQFAPGLLEKLTAAKQIQQPYRGFIEAQPSFDGLFASNASKSGLRRLDVLGWLGNIPFTQDHQLHISPRPDAYRRLVDELHLGNKRYITIHNGWDKVAHLSAYTVTKAWPEEKYVRFVDCFKAKFPDVLVVQLGAKTSRRIENVDLCLVDNTSLHEAAWILKHSLLHVDGDSGLVHLARALHTKSLVLFGPTNHEFFRYAQNETVSSTVCGNCWWATHEWMRSCPRGFSEPACMTSIDPMHVLEVAEGHLSSLPAWTFKAEDSRRHDPAVSFRDWRGDYICEVLGSARGSQKEDPKLAILGGAESLTSRFAGLRYRHTAFTFGPDEGCPADCASGNGPDIEPPGSNGAASDFGSLYNIPAENEEYDIVVAPSFTDCVPFPYFAIKESLRILKERGILIITFDFSSEQMRDESRRGAGAIGAFFQALDDLGVRSGLSRSAAGAIVLRKLKNERITA